MKPSIILYKALPDDLLHRLEEHFTVTQVPNLRPETVAQHADAFANAERSHSTPTLLPMQKVCWAPVKPSIPLCWRKCPGCVRHPRFP